MQHSVAVASQSALSHSGGSQTGNKLHVYPELV